jgi:parallel beta-helix repeat protein
MRVVVLAALVATGLAVGPPPDAWGARALRVDATGEACPDARFTTIQSALDAARPRATVEVCPGVYEEQLVVTKPVRLRGRPGAVVRPVGMVANTTSLRTGRAIAAVVVVGSRATIQGLEIDGAASGLAGCETAPLLMGVFFRGASGALRDSRVHGVRLDVSERACDTGAAVAVQADGETPIRVTITDNVVFDYQRVGIMVNERGARARIQRNVIMGAGPTPDLVQNGVQVGFGANARVQRNVIQNNAVPSSTACTFDGGNLFFAADGGVIAGNLFAGNTAGLIVNGSGNRIVSNALDGMSAGVAAGLDGISVWGDRNLVRRNRVSNMSEAGIRLIGSGNRVLRNTVTGTRAEALCETARTLPGCEGMLAVCGIGLWIGGGAGNTVAKNTLLGNDLDMRDDGLRTRGGLATPWGP